MSIPDRRTVLRSGLAAAALAAVGAATGCTARPARMAASPARHHLIGPRSPQVAAAEAARHATGTVQAGVAPEAGHVDLGGPVVATWSFGGQIPGPEIRVHKGQILRALLVNRLPVETTVHWHGAAIRNDMDGVPGMTHGLTDEGRRELSVLHQQAVGQLDARPDPLSVVLLCAGLGRAARVHPGWQDGHQKVTRSSCPAARTGVPHRRHGLPRRP